MDEVVYCLLDHRINGELQVVDPTKFEVQHPELMGRACDCGRFVYNEKPCGCTVKEWRVDWMEKTN